MITNIRAGLDHVLASAPQLPKASRWSALVRYIVSKILDTSSAKSSTRDRKTLDTSACLRLSCPSEAANKGFYPEKATVIEPTKPLAKKGDF